MSAVAAKLAEKSHSGPVPSALPVSSPSEETLPSGCHLRGTRPAPATHDGLDAQVEASSSWRAFLLDQLEDQRRHISGLVVNHFAAHESRLERMLSDACLLEGGPSGNLSQKRFNLLAAQPYISSEGSGRVHSPISHAGQSTSHKAMKSHSHAMQRPQAPTVREDAPDLVEMPIKQQRRLVSPATEATDTGLHLPSGDHGRRAAILDAINVPKKEEHTPRPATETSHQSLGSSLSGAWTHTLAEWRRISHMEVHRDDLRYTSSKQGAHYPPGSRARRAVERMEALDSLRRQGADDDGKKKAPEQSIGWRQRLQAVTRDLRFELLVFFLILVNVVFVGVEVQLAAASVLDKRKRGQEEEVDLDVFIAIDASFTAVFLVELALRALSEGRAFLGTHQRWWNLFDCFVVLTSALELALNNVVRGSRVNVKYLRFVRIIRVARILRAARLIRLVRFIRGLRMLVDSIFATLKSLLWALVLLLMILYGFALVVTQTVSRYVEDKGMEPVHEKLLEFWVTLPRSMFTLFKCVTGGFSWHEVANPLNEVSPALVVLVVLYISFTLFAVLNVMTGVFCQSAIESAAEDKEMVAIYHMAMHQRHAETMKELFKEIDEDNDGTVTLADFQNYLDHEEVKAFFASLDIDADDAWMLYKLLDKDGQGTLDVQQFLSGCLSLRGSARAIQIAQLQQDNKWSIKLLQCFMEDMFENLDRIHQRLSMDDVNQSSHVALGGCTSSTTAAIHQEGIASFLV